MMARPRRPTADENDGPGALQSQDSGEVIEEGGHIVSPALLAKAAEVAEVLAYLRGGRAESLAQLTRTDDFYAVVAQDAQRSK